MSCMSSQDKNNSRPCNRSVRYKGRGNWDGLLKMRILDKDIYKRHLVTRLIRPLRELLLWFLTCRGVRFNISILTASVTVYLFIQYSQMDVPLLQGFYCGSKTDQSGYFSMIAVALGVVK